MFTGDPSLGDGLRIKTNADSNAILLAGIYGQAELPDISIVGHSPGFLSTPVGQVGRGHFVVRNAGPGHAVIESVTVANEEFTLDPAIGPLPLREFEEVSFDVIYVPTRDTQVNFWLTAHMQAPVESVHHGSGSGISDHCEVSPLLDLGSTSGGELTGTVLVSAPSSRCVIDRLEFVDETPGAAAEFSVDLPGCDNLPCDPGIKASPAVPMAKPRSSTGSGRWALAENNPSSGPRTRNRRRSRSMRRV